MLYVRIIFTTSRVTDRKGGRERWEGLRDGVKFHEDSHRKSFQLGGYNYIGKNLKACFKLSRNRYIHGSGVKFFSACFIDAKNNTRFGNNQKIVITSCRMVDSCRSSAKISWISKEKRNILDNLEVFFV